MAVEEKLGVREAFDLLGPGPFRRYIIGEAVSMTGTWMQFMAQGWVLTTLTQSALMLGLVNFAGALPMLLLSMAGGLAADRFDRRWILQAALFVQVCSALLVAFLIQTDQITIGHLLAVALVLGVAGAFEMPAAAAMVPELVAANEISRAIAIDRSVFHGTRLIGPALAGVCIAKFGAASAFFLNAASFIPLMVALTTMPAGTPRTAHQKESRQSGMRPGFDHLRSDKPTIAMIAIVALTTTLVFPVMAVMMPLYATTQLRVDAGGMGILMGISGAGAMAGSVGLLTVNRRERPSRMAAAAVGVVLALLVLTFARELILGCLGVLTMALSVSTLMGLANTTIQERAPGHIRGRVSALAGLAFFGVMPFSAMLVTSSSDWFGMRRVLFVNACLYALGALAILGTQARKACEPVAEAPPDNPVVSAP